MLIRRLALLSSIPNPLERKEKRQTQNKLDIFF